MAKKKGETPHDKYGEDAVPYLQGMMRDAAEGHAPIPDRFMPKYGPKGNTMIILDTRTGRTSEIGLYGYSAVRQLLTDLFPDPEPKEEG